MGEAPMLSTAIPAVPGVFVVIALVCFAAAAVKRRTRPGSPREITHTVSPPRAPRPAPDRRSDGDIAFIVFMLALLIGLLAGDRIL